MKPDYKNWMPKGLILSNIGIAAFFLSLFLVFFLTNVTNGSLKTVLVIVFLIGTIVGLCVSAWMFLMYRAFSYNGKRQMSKHVIEGIAEYVNLPEGGKGLDVGCGSGALAIACAKRNPKASFIGIDRWGKEYASFNQALCENNAQAEGVGNVSFRRGDATGLDFPAESFDAVMSNYVYHNIPGDRQSYLLETLRVLKKGGTFTLHDIFSKAKYGDMQAFLERLRKLGYESVELIDTTDGKFMTKQESYWMALSGSALLVGRK
jgi:ubiquinone/menaquinone biosynthesis C-methylase UbiE